MQKLMLSSRFICQKLQSAPAQAAEKCYKAVAPDQHCPVQMLASSIDAEPSLSYAQSAVRAVHAHQGNGD